MKTDGVFGAGFIKKLAARMKTDKRLELAVYAALIVLGVVICTFSSCGTEYGYGENVDQYASDSGNGGTETRLAGMLGSIRGAGKVKVMLERTENGEILGAIVIAEGAGDIAVKLELMRAVETVLSISSEQVEVFQMEIYDAEG